MAEARAWTVRAGVDDSFEAFAVARSVVGIGWRRTGDLVGQKTLKAIRKIIADTYSDVAQTTRESYALQLHAFCNTMRPGDPVVLLRENSPEVALGIVTGGYRFEPDTAPGVPAHVRAVNWRSLELHRSDLGTGLLHTPSLSAIYAINVSDAVSRLRDYAEHGPVVSPVEPVGPSESAAENLRRNLEYARSLASAGHAFEQLKMGSFEVTDIYRAAWTQAVAALDHWVHEEIAERMLRFTDAPDTPVPDHYPSVALPLAIMSKVRRGELSLRNAVRDYYVLTELPRKTYQDPVSIREGLRMVANVNKLWDRVAVLLAERAGSGGLLTGTEVVERLRVIVRRRNKIVHEYDHDGTSSTGKRPIDSQTTMRTISWIEQVVEAISLAVDQP